MGVHLVIQRLTRKCDARKLRAPGRRGEMKHRQGQVRDANGMLDADRRNATANFGYQGSPATCGGDRKLWAILFSLWQ